MGWNEMELINICWNYLERILFGGTWNGTGTERVPIKNQVERNGTSSSSELGGTERNEFQKNRNGVQHCLLPFQCCLIRKNQTSSVTLN